MAGAGLATVRSVFSEAVARVPVVPLALAFTAGVVADRVLGISPRDSLIASAAALVAWGIAMRGPQRGLALVYLWTSALAFGAAYHHTYVHLMSADDIRHFAALEPSPVLVRGFVDAAPIRARPEQSGPLLTYPQPAQTKLTLRVTQLYESNRWRPVSGLVRLNATGPVSTVHVGDLVEVTGMLYAPDEPDNPGELDYATWLRDRRIGAMIAVQQSPHALVRLEERSPTSLACWLALVRSWGAELLASHVPETEGLAVALLLGDGSAMSEEDWQRYYQSGVIHVLSISGQHLVVLAAFLWVGLRALRLSQRQGAVVVAGILVLYALVAGGRPPVLRAAVMVCLWCGALWLRRPVAQANLFAFAWLVILLLNPTDAFDVGCQLSFLSVAVLCWGVAAWLYRERDELEQLVAESRSTIPRFLASTGSAVCFFYAVNIAVWLAVTPLIAKEYNLVSLAAVVIGPPTVLLTSIALISGFLLLLVAPVGGPICWLLATITEACLTGADGIVTAALQVPFSHVYVPDLPGWWLVVFYTVLVVSLTPQIRILSGKRLLLAGAGWLLILLAAWSIRPGEFRCTFLAVGHGGCTVIETPEGETLVYDAGAMGGPEVTRQVIAPFLWQRGVRRIDELFLSHADLDHFNGLPALAERFTIARVTCTPSFADRSIRGVRLTLDALSRHGIELRIVKAGDQVRHGSIVMDVLHPPAEGPAGKENVRSMVVHVTHAGFRFLLTGDLEDAGLEMVLRQPALVVDVLAAPHHGSKKSNTPELARWSRPKLVVSSQGHLFGRSQTPEPFRQIGAEFLGTWPDGAVTVRLENGGLIAESYKTKKRVSLDRLP